MSPNEKINLIASQNESEIDIFNNSQAKQSIIDLISGTAPFSGEFFFSAFAENLAKILGIKYVIVSEISEWSDTDPISVKTLSFWDKDKIGDNFEYQLENTPCKDIFTKETVEEHQGIFCIPEGLKERFPNAIGKGCFLGIALLDQESKHRIGHICFMDDYPMANEILAKFIFQFASSWVAAQLQQYKAKRQLQYLEAREREKSQQLAQSLEQLRQADLALIQTEKMASLGNLVAGVAHEINNPIGFLNGSINNAKDYVQDLLSHLALYQQHYPNAIALVQDHAEDIDLEFLSEDLPKLLNSMQGATDRLKNISTSLRTFSRADKDYKVLFNIDEGIDSTILILKYRLKANEQRPAIEVITNYGNLPQIECFPGQLNQVFMNILANAIDALEESNTGRSFEEIKANPNQITITTLVENKGVKIIIDDNGLGMNESVKQKIFDDLFTTKSVGKGTGLGLAIARQIVEKTHGGKLSFNSVLGEGTEFIIEIPV